MASYPVKYGLSIKLMPITFRKASKMCRGKKRKTEEKGNKKDSANTINKKYRKYKKISGINKNKEY